MEGKWQRKLIHEVAKAWEIVQVATLGADTAQEAVSQAAPAAPIYGQLSNSGVCLLEGWGHCRPVHALLSADSGTGPDRV